jgi:hypothetical protein
LRRRLSRLAGIPRNTLPVRGATGRAVVSDDAIPVAGSLTQDDYRADVGTGRLLPAATPKPGCMAADSGTGRHAERSGAGQATESRSAGGANADLRTPQRRRSLRWWPGASPSFTSGPFPFHVAFVVDRLLLRSTPVGGTLGKKFRKIRFRSFVCGPGTFLPASGALESAARCFGK